jgi:hypothetical protein
MSQRFISVLPAFIVAVGESISNILTAVNSYGDSTLIGLTIPTAGAGKLEVSNDKTAWFALKDLAAGATTVEIPFAYARVNLTTPASGTAVTIGVSKQWEA